MRMIKKGFTLVELLVVIGVLAVLMAGVVSLIDPVDKNRAAQDSKVQSDIGQIATALQTFMAASNDGLFPADLDPDLVDNGDLTVVPVPPTSSGETAYDYNGGGTDDVSICGPLQSKKYTATPFWVWESVTGQAGPSATCP